MRKEPGFLEACLEPFQVLWSGILANDLDVEAATHQSDR